MKWEELTGPDFAQAVEDKNICVLPMGIIERHGHHLPLGTDLLNVRHIVEQAVELEPAVVFPPFYFGQIYEARCFPGTISLPPSQTLDLLLAVLDEIGRNGFEKILIVNGHGGNNALLSFLSQSMLGAERPYTLYVGSAFDLDESREELAAVFTEDKNDGHGGDKETSALLAHAPHTVRMDQANAVSGEDLGRLAHLPNPHAPAIWWYARFPNHYGGDGSLATAEKGARLVEICSKGLAKIIRAVRDDEVAPALTREFYDRVKRLPAE
jgi:creatinine amidohydrolase